MLKVKQSKIEGLMLISEIAKRAHKNFEQYIGSDLQITVLDIIMDIETTNKTIPLDLSRLLAAPEADFNHDIIGIIQNLNRETGEIENCFSPRYTKQMELKLNV